MASHTLNRLFPPGPGVSARAFVEELGLLGRESSGRAQGQGMPAHGRSMPAEQSAPAHGQSVPAQEQSPQAQESSTQRPAAVRPRVLLNMASTLDGRATLGGKSGAIGNRADRELFHALRTVVDAVLVGAGTVRVERYRQLVRDDEARALRRARGLAEEPLACIVSARLALEGDIPLLDTPGARVVILTPSQASLPAGRAAQIEYVRTAREGRLDLAAALSELRARFGVRSVLCEGGPHLNGQLLAAGVVDELFLSLAPKLAGGDASSEALRIVTGVDLEPPVELALLSALEAEGDLFLRYGVRSSRSTGRRG
jgi:riboflavin-specific deaminase-like protein